MSETPAHRDDEIDLFKLFTKLWEGKWKIILAMIGASLLGMFYLLILPSSYSGKTFVRAAQPSAFTHYTFLSEVLKTNNFIYKIDDKFVFDAFISEFNDHEEVIQPCAVMNSCPKTV